jgi:TfoX/Sxy family transcriptional regulator of competence genes
MQIGDLAFLLELLEGATKRLPGVARKRLFGCDALFVDGAIFALVWKEGRIGLKFPEPAAFASKMSEPGSKPWAPSGKAMSGWVLVPEALHDDEDTLTTWARESHASVRAGSSAKAPTSKATPKTSKPSKPSKPTPKAKSKAKPKSKSKVIGEGRS